METIPQYLDLVRFIKPFYVVSNDLDPLFECDEGEMGIVVDVVSFDNFSFCTILTHKGLAEGVEKRALELVQSYEEQQSSKI